MKEKIQIKQKDLRLKKKIDFQNESISQDF